MSKDILLKSKQSAKIQIAFSIIAKFIGAVFSIILARILLPDDYGHLTIAILFTGLFTTFSEFGFQSFLIQHDSDDPKFAHSAFFIDVTISLVIAIMLISISWPIANHYETPMLGNMLRLYAVSVVLNSLTRAPLALLKKQLTFKITAQSELIYTISSQGFRLILAWAGFGALCFPLGDIIGHALKSFFVFLKTAFKPRFSLFSRSAAKTIFSFGGKIMFTNAGAYLANQIDKFLISSRFSIETIGFYNFSYTQPTQLFTLIIATQRDVFLSTYSKFKTDFKGLRETVIKVTAITNFLILPIFGFAIIQASLIIHVIFGQKWLPAVLLFQLFCGDYIFRSFFSSVTGIQLALGYAGRAARTKIINAVIFVSIISMAVFFNDITYYAWGYVISSFICALHNLYANGKLIELNFASFIYGFRFNILSFLVTVFMFMTLFKYWFIENLFLQLVCKGSMFLLMYGLISFFINRKTLLSLVNIILPKMAIKNKR